MQISSALAVYLSAPTSVRPASVPTQAPDEAGSKQAQTRANEQEIELQQEIQKLSSRDREVRTHEQAHASVGGQYAGTPTYDFKRGPDGRNYAVSGEVPIDVSPIANDPQATLTKMAQVQRAALAPIEPSSQDRRIAAEAATIAAQARVEITQQRRETEQKSAEARAERQPAESQDQDGKSATASPSAANLLLEAYQRISGQESKVQGLHLKV